MKFWNSLLIIASLSVMALCSYFLYVELTARIDKSGGEVIGTVTFKKRSAARRYSDNVVWEDIAQESEIYNYDAIRTLDFSSAVLSLTDGTRIELDENTMLVVVLSDKGVDINFDRGGVSARSGAGAAVSLNSREAAVSLTGDVSVKSSDKGVDVTVKEGSAKVVSGEKQMEVSSEERAVISEGVFESEKITLFPEYPPDNSSIITFTGTAPVAFSWRSIPDSGVRVEISRSSSFSDISRSFNAYGGKSTVSLGAGDYYWRIVRGVSRSSVSKFTVLQDKKPDLYYPIRNGRVMVIEGGELLNFRWGRSEHAAAYEIVVARDPEMRDEVRRVTAKVNTISLPGLEPGVYYWTAENIYPVRFISAGALSGPVKFLVERVSFSLSRPELSDPGPVTTGGVFTLHWKGVQGADSYRVEVSTEGEFKKNIITRETVNSFIKVEDKPAEGVYFWRVTSLRRDGASGVSETAKLTVTKPVDIVLVSPQEGTVLYSRPEVINFSWSDPNRGEKYLVEISERNDFKRVNITLESDTRSVTGETPGAGSFFWRVKLKDKGGRVIASSRAGSFSIPAMLTRPVLKYPADKAKITAGAGGRIRYEWSRIASATEYEVEVFRRIAGAERTMIIYNSRGNFLEASGMPLYTPGEFSWLVRAKQVKNGRVTALRESERSYFEIEKVELLPPPEVKSPGVLFK